MLATFNDYMGGWRRSASEAAAFVGEIEIMPLPDHLELDDWRSHVPMHLLEVWDTLSTDEQMALFLMGQSATHSYDVSPGCETPIMN
jgi:hypothetical protein